jgi:hypothetical protein
MVVRSFIAVLLLLFSCSLIAQNKLSYTPGISFEVESHRSQDGENNYEYFTTSYRPGVSFNLGMTNKLNYNKLFVRVNANIGVLLQSQKFTFSNEIDNIIEHTVDYQLPFWSLDYSLGRDFQLNELNQLHFELGFSTIGDFKTSTLGSEIYQSGSFTSIYVEADDHYNGASLQEYQYDISYEWQTYLSPFIKCGISLPVSKNRLVFGVTARWNRFAYENFIILSSDNYSAIAQSGTQSSSFGFYLNYEFSK